MASKRKSLASSATTKPTGVLKPSQRFIIAKSGKLSKTNLHALFSSADLWDSLSAVQQLSALDAMHVKELFGDEHPRRVKDGSGKEKFVNYFATVASSPPASTKPITPTPTFDLSTHLDRFREHLKEARFDPKWSKLSAEASAMRARGDFDGIWQLATVEEGRLGEEGLARVKEVRRRRMERKGRGEE